MKVQLKKAINSFLDDDETIVAFTHIVREAKEEGWGNTLLYGKMKQWCDTKVPQWYKMRGILSK